MATNIFTQIEMPDGSIYDLAGGTSVEANPNDLLENATELTGLRVNGEDYKITNNTNIIPNPSKDASETLSKIAINNVIYDINSSNQTNNDIRIDENINSISIDESGNLKITYTKNGIVYTNTYNKDTSETS